MLKHKRLFATLPLALICVVVGGLTPRWGTAAAPKHGSRALRGTLNVFDFTAFEQGPQGARVLAAYRRAHPGVTLKILPLPSGDPTVYEENLLNAGAAPDVVVPSYTQQVFGDLPKNTWLDLTPYLNKPNPYVTGNKRWIDLFNPTINLQNSFRGTTYYVASWAAQDAAFYYNKDIFKKVGITRTPTTWAQFLADCATLKKAGYIASAFPLGDPYPIAENGSFVSLLENQVMSRTFKRLDMDHNGVVDVRELVYGIKHHIYSPMNADYQEAWKLFQQWSPYWEPNPAGVKPAIPGVPTALQIFLHGQAATQYGAQIVAVSLNQAKVKFHWGVFKMPQVTPASSRYATSAEKPTGIWGAWNAVAWGVPTSTKQHGNLALALDFLQYITAPSNDVPVALENSYLPIVNGYRPNSRDTFSSTFYDLLTHPSMQFASEATLGPEWLKERIATQQAYISGQESLNQAMTDMQRYTDQAADRLIKLYNLHV